MLDACSGFHPASSGQHPVSAAYQPVEIMRAALISYSLSCSCSCSPEEESKSMSKTKMEEAPARFFNSLLSGLLGKARHHRWNSVEALAGDVAGFNEPGGGRRR
jgi:hypothetical protein